MNNFIFNFVHPNNEPVIDYEVCSNKRFDLINRIKKLTSTEMEIPFMNECECAE